MGLSLISSVIISISVGTILVLLSLMKKSFTTAVIENDNSCSVTVKKQEQKCTAEQSFLGKAVMTPTKSTPTTLTPNVKEVKQALSFNTTANASLSTPVKNASNKSVIKLQNSHIGSNAWPLNSTPIEKKTVLMEQNYQLPMMKAINHAHQQSPYSVKRSAVDKESSPQAISLHKKPKTLPVLKEGRTLRVPTVYVVHKKAESILKTKGSKRFLENNENFNDSKRRNRDDEDVEKPQKRKLLSIVHVTGKKHKVPSINSPVKFSKTTDLIVTDDDLAEDKRRNEERVRKLLAHKDDDDVPIPSIKPPKTAVSKVNESPNSNQENVIPQLSVETPKSNINKEVIEKPGSDSKVVKSLFKDPLLPESNKDSSKPIPTFNLVGKDLSVSKPTENPNKSEATIPKPSFSFGSIVPASETSQTQPSAIAPNSLPKSTGLPNFNLFNQITNKENTNISNKESSGFDLGAKAEEPKSTFSFAPSGNAAITSNVKPVLNFSSASTKTSSSPSPKLGESDTKPSFNFGGTTTSNKPNSEIKTESSSIAGFSFGNSKTTDSSTAITTTSNTPNLAHGSSKFTLEDSSKAASFGSGNPKGDSKNVGLFGATNTTSSPASNSLFGAGTTPSAPITSSNTEKTNEKSGASSTGFSFSSSTAPKASLFGSSGNTNSQSATADKPKSGFSFGASVGASSSSIFGNSAASTATTTSTAPQPVSATSSIFSSVSTTGTSGNAANNNTNKSSGFSFGGTSKSNEKPGSFGFGGTNASNEKPGGFSFGGANASNEKPSGFSFGDTTKSSEKPSGFSFGGTNTSSEKPSGFSFSGTNTSSEKPSGFSFGGTNTSSEKPSGFSFSGTNTSSEKPSGFSFSDTSNTTDKPNSFGFSGNASEKSVGFGFGNKAQDGKSGFAFGGASSTSTGNTVSGAFTIGQSSGFSFSSNPAGTSTPAPSTGFNFGGGNTNPTSEFGSGRSGVNFGSNSNSNAGFNFGSNSNADASNFNFGGNSNNVGSAAFSSPATPTAQRRIATPRRRRAR